MPKIEIYTKFTCGYCAMAKKLLTQKGAGFEEVELIMNPKRREEMIARAGGKTTVPQIFVGETHVGGYDDLAALDRAGKLDPLLEGA